MPGPLGQVCWKDINRRNLELHVLHYPFRTDYVTPEYYHVGLRDKYIATPGSDLISQHHCRKEQNRQNQQTLTANAKPVTLTPNRTTPCGVNNL